MIVVAEYVQLLLFVLADFDFDVDVDLRFGDVEGDRVDWSWDDDNDNDDAGCLHGCIVFALHDADFLSFFNKTILALGLDCDVPMKPEAPGNDDAKSKNDSLIGAE